jgi:predicted aminopeptidase
VLTLGGCYVMQAATGQLGVSMRSRPIAEVAVDAEVPLQTRERLQLATEARAFAEQELALPQGRSFQRYADIDRPYALWNVVAAPEFSVDPLRWCFPIAGCVAYRGYFAEAAAHEYAGKLRRAGADVTVTGAATYSTLGHLSDPVLSTMVGWPESRLVGTIFHELAHERLYVAGDSAFSEAFASVVEEAGLRRWLVAQGRAGELAALDRRLQREREFAALLRGTRSKLATLYRSGLPPEQMRVEKERLFGRLKFEYSLLRQRWDGYAGYDAWFARTLNNAHLAAVATYHDCVPGLARLLQESGSFAAFYERAAELGAGPAADRAAVCRS